MSKSKSSSQWLKEHFDDHYVNQAKKEGWLSRAVYKLEEIDKQDKLFKPGMNIIDLGAAPGSWSQWVIKKLNHNCNIFALDILPIELFTGVEFIQGDFREDEVYQNLLQKIDDKNIDIVMSDMSPNITGHKEIDIPKAMYLVELSMELADKVLVKDGSLLVKIFQGKGFDEIIKLLRQKYKKIYIRKPKSSRPRSKEVYVLAKFKK